MGTLEAHPGWMFLRSQGRRYAMAADPTNPTKFAATLSELEKALQDWDQAVTQAPSTPEPQKPIYETKLIKELCKQLRELSKE